MVTQPKFVDNRVCLNVLTKSIDNAVECYEAAEGFVLLGIMTRNYHTLDSAINDIREFQNKVNNSISIGLGAGDPRQSEIVSQVSRVIQPPHINQVFTGVSATRALLGQNETLINALVSPSGKVGYVNIATGTLSSKYKAEIPVDAAIALMKDMGANSLKYYSMKGLDHREEYKEVAKACAKNDFILEPTGGIDMNNFEEIIHIALDAGVKKIIPHVYSSIIDKETGNTRPHDVNKLIQMLKNKLN